MKYLLALLLTGCSSSGGLSVGRPFDLKAIKCDLGEPYYLSVTTTTHFSDMCQKIDISWQCLENKGARKYLYVDAYKLDMEKNTIEEIIEEDAQCEKSFQ